MKGILELLGIGGRIIDAKVELKKASIEAQTRAMQSAADGDAQWASNAAQNAANGWLDEGWFVILAAIIFANFVPFLAPYAAQGFDNLDSAPDWFKASVLMSVSFAFGRRVIPSVKGWRRS